MFQTRMFPRQFWPLVLALLLLWSLPGAVQSASSDNSNQSPPLSQGQLEQLVAPIALYPDSLLAQALMASTYPLEVVSAARWVKKNSSLKGNDLDKALAQQNWDPSVKSLVAFPQVLQLMNDKIDWTEQLGDAFLAQQSDIMNAVQSLRGRAQQSGNLQSNSQQKVSSAPRPAASSDSSSSSSSSSTQVIVIEPSNPQVVYVPTYTPEVYGAWPYPSYPPTTWYPAGYVASNLISFGLGVAVGSNFWGDCDWGRGDVNVNVNNFNSFNNRFARYSPQNNIIDNRHFNNIDNRHINARGNVAWNHNVDHRRGVPYQSQALQQRFAGNNSAVSRNRAREQFRGHANQERAQLSRVNPQDISRPGARGGGVQRPQMRPGTHGGGEQRGGMNRSDRARINRPNAPAHFDHPGAANRFAGHQGQAFSRANNGNQAWQERNRGFQSRGNMAAHHPQVQAPRGGGFGGFHGGGGGLHGGGFHRR